MSQHYIWVLHIRTGLGTEFILKWKLCFFGQNFLNKRLFFFSKKENQHWFLYIQISLSITFQLKLTILVVSTKFFKTSISFVKQKTKHHPWVFHIWIRNGPKFQLKATVSVIKIKYVKRGFFLPKTEK